jgi:hypothetical protein
MKSKTIILMLLLSAKLEAQSPLPDGVTPPDYNGDIIAYDTVTKQVFRLEKQKGGYAVSNKAYSGSKLGRTVEGGRSPVRIGENQNVRFFMRWQGMMGMDVNPADVMGLGRFETKKGKRSVTIQSTRQGFLSFGRSETGSNQEYRVAVDFKKMEKEVVEIVLSGKLPPGEYFFGSDRSTDMMCFGVDGSK